MFTVRLPPPMLVVSDLALEPLPVAPSAVSVRVVKNPPMKEPLVTVPSGVPVVNGLLNESKVKDHFKHVLDGREDLSGSSTHRCRYLKCLSQSG